MVSPNTRLHASEGYGAAVEPPFNPEVPSIARVYDYLLRGKDHFPSDHEVGDIFIWQFPGAVSIAVDNHACLTRYAGRHAGAVRPECVADCRADRGVLRRHGPARAWHRAMRPMAPGRGSR